MDSITIDVDAYEVERALNELASIAQPFINEASRATAEAVVRQADARLRGQIAHTGRPHPARPDLGQDRTLKGLTCRPAHDGNGFIVVDEREPFPNVPFWLEKGTRREPAHLFFYVSAQLEVNAHIRRLGDALQHAIDAVGLGE